MWVLTWFGAWTLVVGVQSVALLADDRPVWTAPWLLFAVVVAAAAACVAAALVMIRVALADGTAELGLVGAFTFAVSVLPLVHGLTTPGALYGPNTATMASAFWALPVATVAVLPLAAPTSRWSRRVVARWRSWMLLHILVAAGLGAVMLALPDAVGAPAVNSPPIVAIALLGLAVCVALSIRQLQLAHVARSARPLVVAIGFALVGASALLWLSPVPYSVGFWLAHLFDIVGVLLLAVGAVVVYRQRLSVREVLRPLTVHEPLAALELGLDPLVHRFIASLESKDPITREHVVRVSDLSVEVGQALGVRAGDLHVLGLSALLHDVGKLAVPDAILNKPGALDSEEMATIRLHPITGQTLVSRSRALAPLGPIIRGHHERVDGAGYPDGLTGDRIPLLARVVSVCDAFDAMTNTRQYRTGMKVDRALAILQEHSGSQWDPVVIAALTTVVAGRGAAGTTRPPLHDVGRSVDVVEAGEHDWCACVDALPADLAATVRAVER